MARTGRSGWIALSCAVVFVGAARGEDFTKEERGYWAFQPVRSAPAPAVRRGDWVRNPIDAFVLSRLEQAGLEPAPEAQRRALIRRVTFALHGLPPTAAEIEAFAADDHPQAYERLIDRLLASPHYGERWASHWLDLVRFAESDGFKADFHRPNAWRYRDYVIRSLNDDKPYDRFVVEQLAGDEVAPNDPDAVIATGFLRHWPYEENQAHVRQQWDNILNDLTDVSGQVFLGLTFSCARCHDHKYDPLLQRDYFKWQSFFAPMTLVDERAIAPRVAQEQFELQRQAWEQATAEIRRRMDELEAPFRAKHLANQKGRFPPDIQRILDKPLAERTPFERQLAELAGRQMVVPEMQAANQMKGEVRKQWDEMRKQLDERKGLAPTSLATALSVSDVGVKAPPTKIPGEEGIGAFVSPGYPAILEPRQPTIEPLPTSPQTTGRRAALAAWITRPDHPLTARVMVNRLWHHHFGRGLVATPEDFGRQGERPTHPELLDWLARRFVDSGWSLKQMHRLLLTSATYRQSAVAPPPSAAAMVDPDNLLLWRMRSRRLSAEELRDSLLSASGELNPKMGGPGVFPELPAGVSSYAWKPTADVAERNRRTIYLFVKRNLRHPLLEAFDVPDTHESCARRMVTITAPQALSLLNGDWPLERARSLARECQTAGASPRERIAAAYQRAWGRAADEDELQLAEPFVAAGPEGFVDFCHVLLNANEFIQID